MYDQFKDPDDVDEAFFEAVYKLEIPYVEAINEFDFQRNVYLNHLKAISDNPQMFFSNSRDKIECGPLPDCFAEFVKAYIQYAGTDPQIVSDIANFVQADREQRINIMNELLEPKDKQIFILRTGKDVYDQIAKQFVTYADNDERVEVLSQMYLGDFVTDTEAFLGCVIDK